MRKSPLILISYYIKAVSFSLRPGVSPSKHISTDIEVPSPDVTVKTQKSTTSPLLRQCELTVKLPKPSTGQFPYDFGITIIGQFKIDEDYQNNVDVLFDVNAPALLYGTAREMITSLTGRGGFPSYILPSMTFMPLSEKKTASTKNKAKSQLKAAKR
jgi:preprotein translocase subunit SecB